MLACFAFSVSARYFYYMLFVLPKVVFWITVKNPQDYLVLVYMMEKMLENLKGIGFSCFYLCSYLLQGQK